MNYSEDEIAELKRYAASVSVAEEGGVTFFRMEGLRLPTGWNPPTCTALFCPTAHAGYHSRLYYDRKVPTRVGRNWNSDNVRILDAGWYAFSWNFEIGGLRLAQILLRHLEGLTRCD